MLGTGSPDRVLDEHEVRTIVVRLLEGEDVAGCHVVVLVPDATRSAPIPMMVRLLHDALAGVVDRLDVLVALGTHQPMSEEALDRLVGVTPGRRSVELPGVGVLNHDWQDPDTFADLGSIPAEEVARLSGGRLCEDVHVRVNRLVVDADLVIVCGPVFPHEVVGFSGGNKYFFPGVSGPEVINLTHWLGALLTSLAIIGSLEITPVRRVIDRAASLIPTRKACLAMVVRSGSHDLHGLFAGTPEDAWAAAAALSAQVHIRRVPRPYRTILSVVPTRYTDMWTAAKGMYKVEPIVADGGEVIVYAPHISTFSETHGAVLAAVGYHVRDYYVAQWDRFQDYPAGVLAHSTHLRGSGTYDPDDGERPRIAVTLATGIEEATCRAHGLGYLDPALIDPGAWNAGRDPDRLVVNNAGEILYRVDEAEPTT